MTSSNCSSAPLNIGEKHPFSFSYLWNQTLLLNASNPRDACLYHPLDNQSRLTLTYEGCLHYCLSDWNTFSREDVYSRIYLWFIPLVVLWAATTLPALGFWRKYFTIVHLIADPIDTVYSLFYKLDLATRQFRWAKGWDEGHEHAFTFESTSKLDMLNTANTLDRVSRRQTAILDEQVEKGADNLRKTRDSKMVRFDLDVMALIINAYQEWHLGDEARTFMEMAFDPKWPGEVREAIRQCCETAAAYIAADRVSRFLPATIATILFLVQISTAFWRTLDALDAVHDQSTSGDDKLSVTPQNIAFGVLYFWLPFAVLTTAFVGSANTTNSVPRILRNLRREAENEFERYLESTKIGSGTSLESSPTTFPAPSASSATIQDTDVDHKTALLSRSGHPRLPRLRYNMRRRWAQGGLPTWQPDKFNDWNDNNGDPKFVILGLILSNLVVAVPTIAGIGISWRTPTDGFGCRTLTQIAFFTAWFINHGLDWIICYTIPPIKAKHNPIHTQDVSNDEDNCPIEPGLSQAYFWITLVKDTIFAGGALTTLAFTTAGVFNSCNCWTQWLPNHEARYISFPQEQFVFDTIKNRIQWEFSFVVLSVFLFEVILFGIVALIFWPGFHVLKQRDIETTVESATKAKRTADLAGEGGNRMWRSMKRVSTLAMEAGRAGTSQRQSKGKGKSSLRRRNTEAITNGTSAESIEMDNVDLDQN